MDVTQNGGGREHEQRAVREDRAKRAALWSYHLKAERRRDHRCLAVEAAVATRLARVEAEAVSEHEPDADDEVPTPARAESDRAA
jgi:hypothetical protein